MRRLFSLADARLVILPEGVSYSRTDDNFQRGAYVYWCMDRDDGSKLYYQAAEVDDPLTSFNCVGVGGPPTTHKVVHCTLDWSERQDGNVEATVVTNLPASEARWLFGDAARGDGVEILLDYNLEECARHVGSRPLPAAVPFHGPEASTERSNTPPSSPPPPPPILASDAVPTTPEGIKHTDDTARTPVTSSSSSTSKNTAAAPLLSTPESDATPVDPNAGDKKSETLLATEAANPTKPNPETQPNPVDPPEAGDKKSETPLATEAANPTKPNPETQPNPIDPADTHKQGNKGGRRQRIGSGQSRALSPTSRALARLKSSDGYRPGRTLSSVTLEYKEKHPAPAGPTNTRKTPGRKTASPPPSPTKAKGSPFADGPMVGKPFGPQGKFQELEWVQWNGGRFKQGTAAVLHTNPHVPLRIDGHYCIVVRVALCTVRKNRAPRREAFIAIVPDPAVAGELSLLAPDSAERTSRLGDYDIFRSPLKFLTLVTPEHSRKTGWTSDWTALQSDVRLVVEWQLAFLHLSYGANAKQSFIGHLQTTEDLMRDGLLTTTEAGGQLSHSSKAPAPTRRSAKKPGRLDTPSASETEAVNDSDDDGGVVILAASTNNRRPTSSPGAAAAKKTRRRRRNSAAGDGLPAEEAIDTPPAKRARPPPARAAAPVLAPLDQNVQSFDQNALMEGISSALKVANAAVEKKLDTRLSALTSTINSSLSSASTRVATIERQTAPAVPPEHVTKEDADRYTAIAERLKQQLIARHAQEKVRAQAAEDLALVNQLQGGNSATNIPGNGCGDNTRNGVHGGNNWAGGNGGMQGGGPQSTSWGGGNQYYGMQSGGPPWGGGNNQYGGNPNSWGGGGPPGTQGGGPQWGGCPPWGSGPQWGAGFNTGMPGGGPPPPWAGNNYNRPGGGPQWGGGGNNPGMPGGNFGGNLGYNGQ